jgi:hypothetical protein
VEKVWGEDIKIAIDKVEGIPDGIELLGVFPNIGIPYHLDVGDRGSVGIVILRQVQEVKGKHAIRVYYHVVNPAHLKDWGRILTFVIVPGKTTQMLENSLKVDGSTGSSLG